MGEFACFDERAAALVQPIDDLCVVIQAGGESRRMGRSKATVPFLGEPLMARIVRRLKPIAGEVLITTNEADKLAFLKDDYGWDDIRLVADVIDRRGSLNGIYTALYSADKPYVAIVACDMVFASYRLLAAECAILQGDPQVDAVVPMLSHGYEPFHAVYRRESCLRLVDQAIQAGESRAQSWFPQARLHLMLSEEVMAADPQGGAFINVNTPEDLHAIEARILGEEGGFTQEV